jgi:hypothetical protein
LTDTEILTPAQLNDFVNKPNNQSKTVTATQDINITGNADKSSDILEKIPPNPVISGAASLLADTAPT